MRGIFVSDLHLTDRPQDRYRWKVFEQVKELAVKHSIPYLFILGDLTEFKNYHSSELVNKLVDSLCSVKDPKGIQLVHILKGNHDGLDPDTPYFRFLSHYPWCFYHVHPTAVHIGEDLVYFLPHTRQPEEDWKDFKRKHAFNKAKYLFIHGTVTGAIAETGQALEGIPLSLFDGVEGSIIAGDIHVPQVVGKIVEYIGAPYPIRFGDEFEPRALIIKGPRTISEPLTNLRKHTLILRSGGTYAEDVAIARGDQLKVVIALAPEELHEFQSLKKQALEDAKRYSAVLQKVQLVKLSSPKRTKKPTLGKSKGQSSIRSAEEEVLLFCKNNRVAKDLEELGLELLSGASDEAKKP